MMRGECIEDQVFALRRLLSQITKGGTQAQQKMPTQMSTVANPLPKAVSPRTAD